MQKNIVLIGFMGSGKTAVGKALSRRLKRDFVDLDEVIVQSEGRAITEIFAQSGEAYFRQKEKARIKEFSLKSNLIISCGGGVVLVAENLENLKRGGTVIYLKAAPQVILARTRHSSHRPLLNVADPQKKIKKLLAAREPLYLQADIIVDTTRKSVSEVVEEIISKIETIGRRF